MTVSDCMMPYSRRLPMLKSVGINSIAEAMFYYSDKANRESVESKLEELIQEYPEKKAELVKAAEPAIRLNKLLNAKLDIDKDLVSRFFKKIGNRRPHLPFGYCLAFIMMGWPLTIHIDYSPDEMYKYLRECPQEEYMYNMYSNLTESGEDVERRNYGFKEISKRVEGLQASYENKWEIINAVINYQSYMEDLLSIIIPAANLIEAEKNKYGYVVSEFQNKYSDKNVEAFFKEFFGVKMEPIKTIKIAPTLFRFYSKYAAIERPLEEDAGNNEYDSSAYYGGMFLGSVKHLITSSTDNDLTRLSKKMQVLSDATRLKILFYLCSNRAYGQELCTKFDLVPPALSYHISKLLTAGFVSTELSGGRTYYTADKGHIMNMVNEFVDRVK